ncbi:hypothetical protein [Tunicatimonas pelagia]|uniref:hypothetical protein n=1 Tax=Tunicatimonas pelagia TaxID=931531 RepID=UPI002664FC76|nr:hypothetical protein [Tunicatimonas pelagia]WKN46446.1 hypothetical protein P0M28_30825 [Tunicatimonas pelagia]
MKNYSLSSITLLGFYAVLCCVFGCESDHEDIIQPITSAVTEQLPTDKTRSQNIAARTDEECSGRDCYQPPEPRCQVRYLRGKPRKNTDLRDFSVYIQIGNRGLLTGIPWYTRVEQIGNRYEISYTDLTYTNTHVRATLSDAGHILEARVTIYPSKKRGSSQQALGFRAPATYTFSCPVSGQQRSDLIGHVSARNSIREAAKKNTSDYIVISFNSSLNFFSIF